VLVLLCSSCPQFSRMMQVKKKSAPSADLKWAVVPNDFSLVPD